MNDVLNIAADGCRMDCVVHKMLTNKHSSLLQETLGSAFAFTNSVMGEAFTQQLFSSKASMMGW